MGDIRDAIFRSHGIGRRQAGRMTPLDRDLERRISILECTDGEPSAGRRLPRSDRVILAVLTLGSLCAVWIAQAL